ncbi:hypothetical protein LTR27_005611 [Elasticomyces elasticus]|nr:hypothetical protein LTR27_005611 [Elasticomyces elasticus]
MLSSLDNQWEANLIEALARKDVNSNAGPGFVKEFEKNKNSFEPVGMRVIAVVGKECDTDKLVERVDKTNKMLKEGLEKAK